MDTRLRYRFIMVIVSILASSSRHYAATPENLGFSLSLTHNYAHGRYVDRSLELNINGKKAGHVNYKISREKKIPSFISYLFVEKPFRGILGCGKMLLYNAINDILLDGSTAIELDRSPFDLSYSETYSMRDEQLKKWYAEFGFVETVGRRMVLTDPAKFNQTHVVTSFTDEGIVFLFR